MGVLRDSRKFSAHPYIGALHGHLCGSSAVLNFFILNRWSPFISDFFIERLIAVLLVIDIVQSVSLLSAVIIIMSAVKSVLS